MNVPASKSTDSKLRTLALVLLPLLGIALVGFAIYATQSKKKANVTVVLYGEEAANVNTGDILDATVPGNAIVPRVGYRYKVFVDDESGPGGDAAGEAEAPPPDLRQPRDAVADRSAS